MCANLFLLFWKWIDMHSFYKTHVSKERIVRKSQAFPYSLYSNFITDDEVIMVSVGHDKATKTGC